MRFRRWEANEDDPAVVPTAILGEGAYGAEALRHGLRTRYILPLLAVPPHEAWQRLGAVALGC
jgi:hypothetical protein